MLFSTENHVKTHRNQRLWSMLYSPEHLSGATSSGHTMAPEAQMPAQCPDRVQPHSDMGVQLLENKALSWGTIRKAACILAEITIRKSQNPTLIIPIPISPISSHVLVNAEKAETLFSRRQFETGRVIDLYTHSYSREFYKMQSQEWGVL